MRTVEYWQARLTTAVRESEDADRVWRQAMRNHDQLGSGRLDPHVLWQERERSRARVQELQALVNAAQQRRSSPLRRRIRAAQHLIAFVAWHTEVRVRGLPY